MRRFLLLCILALVVPAHAQTTKILGLKTTGGGTSDDFTSNPCSTWALDTQTGSPTCGTGAGDDFQHTSGTLKANDGDVRLYYLRFPTAITGTGQWASMKMVYASGSQANIGGLMMRHTGVYTEGRYFVFLNPPNDRTYWYHVASETQQQIGVDGSNCATAIDTCEESACYLGVKVTGTSDSVVVDVWVSSSSLSASGPSAWGTACHSFTDNCSTAGGGGSNICVDTSGGYVAIGYNGQNGLDDMTYDDYQQGAP